MKALASGAILKISAESSNKTAIDAYEKEMDFKQLYPGQSHKQVDLVKHVLQATYNTHNGSQLNCDFNP
ncbi:hypothetical protein DPMN_111763 [Dreissena polymorpha]|uniref:Uncharacterized protein n=1 Tax=Dreissena polymorpha TaxID=45954 RepID=A0A9D4KEF9_DREPO|nr:hypothetical protein DPMN_111763 [Dreissena polymorpha]